MYKGAFGHKKGELVMFVGFNLEDIDKNIYREYESTGRALFNEQKRHVRRRLEAYISANGSIDGTALQNDWFPAVEADIFLSHSHGDQELAIRLAGAMKEWFGLKVFIDSCVWGHADDLLEEIDKVYSWDDSEIHYDVAKRNRSTSHVHTMLSGALTRMMDKAECLIFLNTPNSLSAKEIVNQTKSPWIFHEISTSSLLRKKEPLRYTQILKKAMFESAHGEKKFLDITYDVDLSHLTPISLYDLIRWKNQASGMQTNDPDCHPLDILYKKKGLVKFNYGAYRG